MMNEIIAWLNTNKIEHKIVDPEVVEVVDMGQVFVQDTTKIKSIFKKDVEGYTVFNCMENSEALIEDGIYYVAFQFGGNWYYTDIRKSFKLNILKYIGKRTACLRPEQYVNLGVHTGYELLNGSGLPKSWVMKAKHLGHSAIGVCDVNTMASLFSLQNECAANEITPVFGYSLQLTCLDERIDGKVYAQSQEGLRNLLRIQKTIMVEHEDQAIEIEELLSLSEGNVFVFGKLSSHWMTNNPLFLQRFKESFDDVYYQVDLSEYKADRFDVEVLQATKAYFDHSELREYAKPILINDCYYLDKSDAINKVNLNKIAESTSHRQSDEQYFKDIDEQYELFVNTFDADRWDVDALFAECCEGTLRIAEGAKAAFETSRNHMPKYDMTETEKAKYGTTHNMFNQLLEEGLKKLIPEKDQPRYRKQMEYEKYIIESTNNVDYLLVQYDTVNWCHENNILVGCGRGSAAGCLLLYLLGITLVDPIRFNLIFERFLLPERAGLYPSETTIVGKDVDSTEYVEIELDGKHTISLDKDAELIVRRESEAEPIKIYADQLQEGDDILFDNKDELFTLPEIWAK